MTDPDPRHAALEEFSHRARLTAQTDVLDAAALEAWDALTAAGVDVVLLKGPALAQTLYRPGEHRGYGDVDLLAAPGDRAAAGAALTALGYANITAGYGVDELAGNVHAHHWSRFVEGSGSVSIDLHWRLPGCEAAQEASWAALRNHRTAVELQGRRVEALDRVGLALHLALHVAQHGPGDVKALGDLGRGLDRWPYEIWEQATGLARDLQAVEAFAAGLRLLPAGVARADELRLPQAGARLWAIAHRNDRPAGVFHLTAFTEAAGARERIGILRHALLPQRAWIARVHPWAAGGGLRLIAAYAVHAFRSPAWAARAWRFRRRVPR